MCVVHSLQFSIIDAEQVKQFSLFEAERGYGLHKILLGNRFRKGDGVKKDPEKAAGWYESAFDDAIAKEIRVARCSRWGESTRHLEKNWDRKVEAGFAARYGHMAIADMYSKGELGVKTADEAMAVYLTAFMGGIVEPNTLRDDCENTPKTILMAHRSTTFMANLIGDMYVKKNGKLTGADFRGFLFHQESYHDETNQREINILREEQGKRIGLFWAEQRLLRPRISPMGGCREIIDLQVSLRRDEEGYCQKSTLSKAIFWYRKAGNKEAAQR